MASIHYSKEEVFEVLQSIHLQCLQHNDLLGGIILELDLTILDWIDEFDLLNWKKLSKHYATFFKIEELADELRLSMYPLRKKTLEDFCAFIAMHAMKPEVHPIKLLGAKCMTAGIFRYLRGQLIHEIPEAKSIAPSTPLTPFLDQHFFTIIQEVYLIHPKVLPLIEYQPNQLEKKNWMLLAGACLTWGLAGLINSWFLAGIGLGLFLSYWWVLQIIPQLPADQLEFPGMYTFRDLVKCIEFHLSLG